MYEGLQTLNDREKEVLRLLLIGHDAKSAASALGLSVHTVNERLRDSRRKIGVTSSREAARILGEVEDKTPKLLGDKKLGVALHPHPPHPEQAKNALGSQHGLILLGGGIVVIILLITAVLLALPGAESVAPVAERADLQEQPQAAAPAPAANGGMPAPGMALGSMDLMPIADTNGDGQVTPEEYRVFSEQGWGFVSQGKDSVNFAQLDLLSQMAFFGIAPNAEGLITRQMYIEAIPNRFTMFDQNGDSTLSAAEINGTAFSQ